MRHFLDWLLALCRLWSRVGVMLQRRIQSLLLLSLMILLFRLLLLLLCVLLRVNRGSFLLVLWLFWLWSLWLNDFDLSQGCGLLHDLAVLCG